MESTQLQSRRFLWPGLVLAGLLLCFCLMAAAVAGYFYLYPRETVAGGSGVEYVLDVSSRMDLPASSGQGSRLVVARGVMAEILRPATVTAPTEATVAGLRVFGSGSAAACEDTDLVVPLAPANQQRITAELGVLATGTAPDAPLAQAMIAAIRDLAAVPGPKSLVVVTGGQDSCQVEAGRLIAQEAERAGIDLRSFVIGFEVTPNEAQAIKEMVATDGNSLYLDAPDETALRQILRLVQSYVENPNRETLAAIEAEAAVSGPASVNLTQNPGLSYGPQLVLDRANQLHLVWWDNSLRATGGDVLYRQRMPDGNWTAVDSLTSDFTSLISQYDVQLRLRPDGAVCAFWVALEELQYYQRCRHNGAWDTPQPIFRATGIKRDFQPAFAPAGDLHLIYLDMAGDIHSGEQQQQLSDGPASDAKLAIDANGRLHAVWMMTRNYPYTVEHRWSDDGGVTWSPVATASAADGAERPPSLKADAAGNVHLVWQMGNTLYYRRWQSASGWQPAVVITRDNGRAACDNIALDVDAAGLVHVAWHNGNELLYTQQQAGQNWTPTRRLESGECHSNRTPVLAVDSAGQAHLIWTPRSDEQGLYYLVIQKRQE
jgi:hypothetical protein